MIDTAKLRALAEAATPGGWFAQEHRHWADPKRPQLRVMYTATDAHNLGAKFSLANIELYGTGRGSDETNAAFIAAANPQTVIALLDDLDACMASRAKLLEYETLYHSALESLEEMTAARDEACDLASATENPRASGAECAAFYERIAELRKVGK